jgi:hypothetical protein
VQYRVIDHAELIWHALQPDIECQLDDEPILATLTRPTVLDHELFSPALSALLAQKMA